MLADDTTLHTLGKDTDVLKKNLEASLKDVSDWCSSNHMVLNPSKSKSMVITTRQKHQLSPLSINLSIDGNNIEQVRQHNLLGLIIDDKLSWKDHIENLCKFVSKNTFLLSKLQSIITFEARKLYFNAHIKPHIDYASVIWDGCSDVIFKKLNSIHRRSAKLVLQEPLLTTEEKMKSLEMLPLTDHLKYNKAIFMYKILNHEAPKYLRDLFKLSNFTYASSRQNLAYPCAQPRVNIYTTSLSYSGVDIWNTLPPHVKSACNLKKFKQNVHRHLLNSGVS